jgi:hypothetical protein
MSLQNRIKNILYQKAHLMGYGGYADDGGYIKGTTKKNYLDANEWVNQNYPNASPYEIKKLRTRRIREHDLRQVLKPYNPRFGFHPVLSEDARKKTTAALSNYKIIYQAILLSRQFMDYSAAQKRKLASDILKDVNAGRESIDSILQQLQITVGDIQSYNGLSVKDKKRLLLNIARDSRQARQAQI